MCGSVTSVVPDVTLVSGGSVINLGSVGSVTGVDVVSGVVLVALLDATKFVESTLQPHRWTSKVQSMTDTAASGGRAAFHFLTLAFTIDHANKKYRQSSQLVWSDNKVPPPP